MRAVIFLFWIFAQAAETLVLQPSLNVSELQNSSMVGGSWAEWSDVKLTSTVEEDKQKWEEELESNVTAREEDTDALEKQEHGRLKEEDQKMPVEEQKQQTTERTDLIQSNEDKTGHTFNDSGKFANGNKTHVEIEDEDSSITPNQNITSLHFEYVSPSTRPLYSTITQSPPSVPQLSTENTKQTTSRSVPEAVTSTSTLFPNGTNTSTNSSDSLTEKVEFKSLHEEKLNFAPTVMAARAGPTAVSLPRTSRPKPQPYMPKDNHVAKTKKNKPMKKDKAKEKKSKSWKKAKKVQNLKVERNEVTTAPYFPYFKDHYCPPDCACYGRVVQCSDKGLDKIPYGIPYNSRYILLMNNRIDNIPLNLLPEYLSMEFLVLSNNHLTDSSVEGTFEGIQALKRLYLEKNLLQSIPADLPASLEELRLDGNKVKVMSEAAWRSCPGLMILSLSNNSLGSGSSVLPAGVLSPLVSLRTLSLSYNQLTSVPLNLPISLQELFLRGNHIQRFQGGVFQGRAELQVLDLSANKLTNKGLGKNALINATRLESLNLEGNFLKHVPRHLPRSLKTLNLEGNSISSISKAVFLSLPHLEHLGLARNKISRVAPGAFLMLPLLHQLDLSHNSLRQVPRQLPTWLVSLTLTNNKIQTIPRDAFCWTRHNKTPSSRLVRVQLENNLVDLGSLDSHVLSCLRGFQVVHFY